jgi:uncharacterized protein (DUF58 family)
VTIDPGFLDELGRFGAVLDRQTAALQQGDTESPRIGEGLTFSDYRRYSPGDDTRLIDWKLFARTEEYFIKQFEEERSLTVHLLVDASGSMDYDGGDPDGHKFEYAAKLALGFGYLTAENNDDYRFLTFGETADRLDGGRSNRGELLDIIDQLNATTPSGEAAFDSVLSAYAERIRSRSLVVVFSDCLADPEEIENGVAALTRKDVDVLVVRVLSPAERDPPVAGDALFDDPESNATRRSYFSGTLADDYRTRLDAHVDAVSERVTALRVDHVLVDTGTDYFDAFASVWLA